MIKIKKSRTCHHVSLEVHHIGFQPKNLALKLRLYQQTWQFPSSPQVQLHIYPLPAQKTMNLTNVIIKLKLADRFDNAFFFLNEDFDEEYHHARESLVMYSFIIMSEDTERKCRFASTYLEVVYLCGASPVICPNFATTAIFSIYMMHLLWLQSFGYLNLWYLDNGSW